MTGNTATTGLSMGNERSSHVVARRCRLLPRAPDYWGKRDSTESLGRAIT